MGVHTHTHALSPTAPLINKSSVCSICQTMLGYESIQLSFINEGAPFSSQQDLTDRSWFGLHKLYTRYLD